MNDHDAFLAEIIANPEDDTPRLIYADWLEEQGEPRGEFIRNQCELESLEDDEPRYFDLSERNEDIFATHKEEWSAPFEQDTRKVEFHRGFVDTVTMKARDFPKKGATIYRSTPVRWLRFNYLKGKGALVAKCEKLHSVTGLNLDNLTIPEADLIALLSSPFLDQLDHLSLRAMQNSFSAELGTPLASSSFCTGLESLSLNGTELETGFGRAFAEASSFPNLKKLTVGSTYNPSRFRELNGLNAPNLESLTIEGNLSSTDVNVLRVVGQRLKHLDISHTRIESQGMAKLHEIGLFQEIEVLKLGFNEMTDSELAPLFSADNLSKCKELCLAANHLEDASLRSLTAHPNLSQLRKLNLMALDFSEQALLEFFHNAQLPNLTEICVPRNSFTAQVALSMQHCSFRESLKTLKIDGCLSDFETVQAFSEIEFPNVTRVEMDSCPGLFNEGFRTLMTSSTLKNVRYISAKFAGCTPLVLHAFARESNFPELRELHFYDGTSTEDAVKEVLNSDRLPKLRRLALHGVTGMKNRPKLKKEFGERFAY